jgi:regulator of sigma E protease
MAFAINLYGLFLGLAGIAFLIAFHELGHFLACKIFNIRTPSFSVGFGPKLFSKKIGDTLFSLSAIPLGGYVEIAGIEELGQGEQKHGRDKSDNSFAKKRYYQKAIVLLGGIIFNMFFAYVAISLLYFFGIPKTPSTYPDDSKVIIDTVNENSPAAKAALKTGESILKINNTPVANSLKKTLEAIKENAHKKAQITVEKDNQTRIVDVDLCDSLGVTFKEDDKIVFEKSFGLIESFKKGLTMTWDITSRMIKSLIEMIKQRDKKSLGGPLMVITQLITKAQKGFSIYILLLALISINLAVLNLLPLPILDGGQLVKVTIEALIRRPLPEKMIYYIDYACWISMILLMAYISFFDMKKMCGY